MPDNKSDFIDTDPKSKQAANLPPQTNLNQEQDAPFRKDDPTSKPPAKKEVVQKFFDPVENEEVSEPVVVNYQFDRDTTIEAVVISAGKLEGTVNLDATGNFAGNMVTNVSLGPQGREFKNVRRGSKREVGTWFPIEDSELEASLKEQKDSPSQARK